MLIVNLESTSNMPGDSVVKSCDKKPQLGNEAFVLTLPGDVLDVSLLVNKQKKFRTRNGRDGALAAMKNLEKDGLGKLVVKSSKGTVTVSQYINHHLPQQVVTLLMQITLWFNF